MIDAGLSVWGDAVAAAELSLGMMVLLVFAYHFLSLAWKGRTLGKVLLDLQVRPASGATWLTSSNVVRRALASTVTDFGLFAGACWALVNGLFKLAVILWLIAIAAFWINLIPVVGRRQTVGDLLSNTTVVRTDLYRTAGRIATEGGQLAREAARIIVDSDRVQNVLETTPVKHGRGILDKVRRRGQPVADPAVSGEYQPGGN